MLKQVINMIQVNINALTVTEFELKLDFLLFSVDKDSLILCNKLLCII